LFSEVNDGLRALALGLSLVAVLAGCQKNNSNHWDSLAGRALPSGVYYSRLSLDGYTTACSMTYIK